MIADTTPIGRIGPDFLPKENPPTLKLQPDRRNDKLGMFFSNLSWTDRQILALHFAENARIAPNLLAHREDKSPSDFILGAFSGWFNSVMLPKSRLTGVPSWFAPWVHG